MRQLAYVFAVLSAVVAFSCKPSVPREYIQPDDMEDILYDYHIAMAMAETGGDKGTSSEKTTIKQRAYKLAVLKEHEVSEAQFDSSLKYYMRHTERLHDMYEGLSERLSGETAAMGAGGDAGYRRILTANGDSADIWTGDRNLLLLADAPYNKNTFAFKADTAFHKGDRLQLSFKSQYIVQEGSRDAVVLLCVKFANDSIASQYQRVSSNMRQTVTIVDNKRVGIKEVKGYMLFGRGLNNPSSTLKLLFITDIQFLRIHTKEVKADAEKTDSIQGKKVQPRRDSTVDKPIELSDGPQKIADKPVPPPAGEPSAAARVPVQKQELHNDAPKRRPVNAGPPRRVVRQ